MYSKEISLRFSDMDMYGHLNHAKYITLLETARTELFLDEFFELQELNILLLITHVECSYKKPVTLKDRVIIDMEFYPISRTRFEGKYVMHNGSGLIYAEAKTVLACFDANKKKSTDIPACLIKKFKEK